MTEKINNSEWTIEIPRDCKFHWVRKIGTSSYSKMTLVFFSPFENFYSHTFIVGEFVDSLEGYEFSVKPVYVPGIFND